MKILLDSINTINAEIDRVWISITGFRTLLVLTSLMEKPRSIDELVNILKQYNITQKSVSKDTIRITLNTLKTFGCDIERPTKNNGHSYKLNKHPFVLNLSQTEVDSLLLIRERLSYELTWEKVICLNNFYDKFFALTQNENYIEVVKNTKPLREIDLKILNDIANTKIVGKKVNLTYKSPEFGIENIDIIPQKLSYENGRLYLWCYSYKYERTSILSIERIIKINTISISKITVNTDSYDVEYLLLGKSAKEYTPEQNETITEKTKQYIKIKAKVLNEFWFIQRLLQFGTDFRIISPYFFKEKLITKIKLIQKGYQE